MADNRLTVAAGSSPVDAYLGELAALLHGPRRRRTQILTELRDGLHHAADERIAEGTPPTAAAKQAIAEFGTPREVADAFAAELTTAYARRTIAAYVATGPLVGIWWLLLLQPHPWRTGLLALLVAIPVIPVVAVAIMTAATTLATTGRLIRWLPEAGPRGATAAVLAIASLAALADTSVIAIYLRAASPGRPLAIIAIAASLTRIIGSAVTLRHASTMRQALTGHEVAVGDTGARR
ncbi:MAG: permease prefix domain 1-containing protein [Micromonosporaceae bacterium]